MKLTRKETIRLYHSRLGKKGGKARMQALTPERRSEIARDAAKARWKKAAKVAVLLILVSALPASAQEQKRHIFTDLAPYAALIAGNTADLVSSRQAFDRGAGEVNPMLEFVGSSKVGITITKIAVTAVLVYEMRYLSRHGHPKAAKWLGYLDGAAMGAVALNNRLVLR